MPVAKLQRLPLPTRLLPQTSTSYCYIVPEDSVLPILYKYVGYKGKWDLSFGILSVQSSLRYTSLWGNGNLGGCMYSVLLWCKFSFKNLVIYLHHMILVCVGLKTNTLWIIYNTHIYTWEFRMLLREILSLDMIQRALIVKININLIVIKNPDLNPSVNT